MQLRSLCLLLGTLSSLVGCVLLENAFRRDWILHFYGQLQQHRILRSSAVIGLSDNNQLFSIFWNSDQGPEWTVNMREFGKPDKFLLARNDSLIASYTDKSPHLFLFHADLGKFVRKISLKSPAVKVLNFLSSGLIILDKEGDILHSSFQGRLTSILTKNAVKDLKCTYDNGYIYILTDDLSLISISPDLRTQIVRKAGHSLLSGLENLKSLSGEFLVTNKDRIGRILENQINIVSNKDLSGEVHTDGDLIYTLCKNSISFFELKDALLVPLTTHELNYTRLLTFQDASFRKVLLFSTEQGYTLIDYSDLTSSDSLLHVTHIPQKMKQEDCTLFIGVNSNSSLYLRLFLVDNNVIKRSEFSLSSRNWNSSDIALQEDGPTARSILIIDKPYSKKSMKRLRKLVESTDYNFFGSKWIFRLLGNLSDAGEAVWKLMLQPFSSVSRVNRSPTALEQLGMSKLLVYFNENTSTLSATDIADHTSFWKTSLNIGAQKLKKIVDLSSKEQLAVIFDKSIFFIDAKSGKLLREEMFQSNVADILIDSITHERVVMITFEDTRTPTYLTSDNLKEGHRYVKRFVNSIAGFKISEGYPVKTWEFKKSKEIIITFAQKPVDSKTGSVGIPLANRSVLYKYLNPNLVVIMTKELETGSMKLYALDGISGNVLYIQEEQDDIKVDYNSIKVVIDDNWIIYSYFIHYPRVEQRVSVIDLFMSKNEALNSETCDPSLLSSTYPTASSKSFVFPEKIELITSTLTKFGVTTKSIIFLTDDGNLVEVPKYILNSRRIANRKLSKSDRQDDFRMSPYDPVIPFNTLQVLNHQHKLLLSKDTNALSVKETDLESTSVICFSNELNIFCTIVQPSLSFDFLRESFNKNKVILVIVIMLLAYFITSMLVKRKKLNSRWIDQ